jgi:hypothetical protein
VGDFDMGTNAFGERNGRVQLGWNRGFTLGAELGRLIGRYGTACDNLLAAKLRG